MHRVCFKLQVIMKKEIIIDGVRIVYDESGPERGAPVVLMHGWGCDHSTVRSVAALLEPGLHVYNIDLPGHGESDEPPTAWGVEDFTRLIEKFCKQNGIEHPTLIGHSFGGRISLLMASRNDVPRMVLIDGAGIKPKRPLKYYLKVYSFKAAKKIFPLIFGEKKGQQLIDKWRGSAGSADYRNSTPVMRAVMSRCVNEDLKHVMPDIKASTLLIWGENDTATPISDARYMEKHIPDAGLVAFPDAGHYSFLDNPGGFAAVMREFFKKDLEKKK